MFDELLILPGSIPGLLRYGSPLRILSRPMADGAPEYGLLVSLDPGRAEALVCAGRGLAWLPLSDLSLDLTDATGRAHAAWWLAGEAKWWPAEPNYTTAIWRRWNFDPATTGGCKIGIGPRHWWPWSHEALATLDPNDPRLLPDGSSWVDAEALRLVCLHVAGLEVARG